MHRLLNLSITFVFASIFLTAPAHASQSVRQDLEQLSVALSWVGAPQESTEIKRLTDSMSDEQLADAFGPSSVQIEELSNSYFALADQLAATTSRESAEDLGRVAFGPVFPPIAYSADCPKSSETDTATMLIAFNTLEIAKGVWSAASRACDEVIVAIGAGGNVSVACIAADAILFAAELVLANLEFCNGDIAGAEASARLVRQEHVHDDLTQHDIDLKTALATHDADLKADLLQHDTDIKAQLDRMEATLGRLEDLMKSVAQTQAEQMLHAMGGKRAGVMYTDRLEEVCDLAEDAILDATALNYRSTGKGEALLMEGRSVMATDPKEAHDLCRAAYRDATGRSKRQY